MLKILGVGLSKTGTTSLHRALKVLGYKSLHYDRHHLNGIISGRDPAANFRVYDNYDAVTDIPTAFFFKDLLSAYPDCRAVLTVRDVESWYTSVYKHMVERAPLKQPSLADRSLAQLGVPFARRRVGMYEDQANIRKLVYGSVEPREHVYKLRYLQHEQLVRAEIPPERLLVMDVIGGDGWEKLCGFLDVPIPDVPFPWQNRTK